VGITNPKRTIDQFARERAALLPVLLAVQEAEGYLSESSLRAIALHVYVP
jgi:NADH:ubiquinone oxidoreductase subunit E